MLVLTTIASVVVYADEKKQPAVNFVTSHAEDHALLQAWEADPKKIPPLKVDGRLRDWLAAHTDDTDALYWFALIRLRGLGDAIPADWEAAATPLRRAAEMGHPSAQYRMYELCKKRLGNEGWKSPECISWLTKAADAGVVPAVVSLGQHLVNGVGMKMDTRAAFRCFIKAAVAGNTEGMRYAATCYTLGTGVNQNADEALLWLQKAASMGDVRALGMIGEMYNKGIIGGGANYPKAAEYYLQAAELGDVISMNYLGAFYMEGRGVPRDLPLSFKWFMSAAEQGFSPAMFNLGSAYMLGNGTKQDYSEGHKWFLKSAEAEWPAGMRGLGLSYFQGRGVERDYNKAREWFQKAAMLDDGDAMLMLGKIYLEALGIERDIPTGSGWIRRAAEKGNTHAIQWLREHPELNRP